MFVPHQEVGAYRYLQSCRTERRSRDGCDKQVIATLGRLDVLQKNRSTRSLLVLLRPVRQNISAGAFGPSPRPLAAAEKVAIGPALVSSGFVAGVGLPAVVRQLLQDRSRNSTWSGRCFYGLHRLFAPGSESRGGGLAAAHATAARRICSSITFTSEWLGGEPLPGDEQAGPRPRPAVVKALLEEGFSSDPRPLQRIGLCVLRTTSILLRGARGRNAGRFGHSKDHRSDRKQMVWARSSTPRRPRVLPTPPLAGNQRVKRWCPIVDG